MRDMNYIGGIVRILEPPKQRILKKTIPVTRFRVQFPTSRSSFLVNLIFWGNLARVMEEYYKVNDYILIEGYLSVRKKKNSKLPLKKAYITVLKVYPFDLRDNIGMSKI